ncbi:hypothetical protein HPP92_002644 [Vanilla planifolia]|uniref:Uncharacterized protein n=1 Tax=Vanilla planifolia TaxID=51239 RepID=A0A835RW92_VANPL|nr:hypothetical protein HPP92_002644 [Vanilla planifolia]
MRFVVANKHKQQTGHEFDRYRRIRHSHLFRICTQCRTRPKFTATVVSTNARSDPTVIAASKATPTHHLVGLIATPKPTKATFSYHNVVPKDGVIGVDSFCRMPHIM